MTHQFKAIKVEGQVVVVKARHLSTYSVIDFLLFSERHSEDCYETMVGWKNPTKAFRKIIEASVSLLEGKNTLIVSALDWKRIFVYKRMAERMGAETHLLDNPDNGDSDPCLKIIIKEAV